MGAYRPGKSPAVIFIAALIVLASIVAKGLGIIAIIFGLGLLVGVVLTAMVMHRLHR